MSESRIDVVGKGIRLPALALLLAIALAGSSLLFVNTPTEASSSPNFSISRSYFATAAKRSQVGFLTCDCQGNERLNWGRVTPHFTEHIEGFCSPF